MDVSKEYSVCFTPFDKEKIIQLLCDQHDFSKERIISTLEKLEIIQTSKKQKGLGEFFS